MDFTNTVSIDRPAEEVFRFVSDLENVPQWKYAVSKRGRALTAL
jgi:uncharacterized membrane protein